MTEKLCIFVCDNFRPEVEACIESENRDDVMLASYPSRCGHPEVSWQELSELASEKTGSAMVLGRACISSLPHRTELYSDTSVIHLDQCFHLIADTTLVDEAIASGSYLISPGWLKHWRQHLKAMGFTEEDASGFFQDFAKELLLLDTGIDPESDARFIEMQAAVKLPARRLAVGLHHTRLLLTNHINEWRLNRVKAELAETTRQHNIERADFQSAMDMLTRLALINDELEAVSGIQDLFQMLFAPRSLYYLQVLNNRPLPDSDIPEAKQAELKAFENDYGLTDNGRGFFLKIRYAEKIMGKILVEQLAFPEHVERYLNMAMAISGVCGLVIENARNQKKLLEAEKMASLGIVVAGVAHEINTPLGVGVTTTSTIKNQTSKLSQQFAEHSMTQSNLENYLENIETETVLLASNLGKISRLVDQFRQLAVDGGREHYQNCQLNQCLNDVISSFGDNFEKHHIAIEIKQDPALEISALTSDWASIFRNLISNSLKHGFTGRDSGNITIAMHKQQDLLKIIYRDDGKGMDKTDLGKIFDPFFSTDLQNGMGLGMHLVYNLVTHRFRGSIHCDSQPGQGLTCTIEVPL